MTGIAIFVAGFVVGWTASGVIHRTVASFASRILASAIGKDKIEQALARHFRAEEPR